jgi:hypothetical protein
LIHLAASLHQLQSEGLGFFVELAVNVVKRFNADNCEVVYFVAQFNWQLPETKEGRVWEKLIKSHKHPQYVRHQRPKVYV